MSQPMDRYMQSLAKTPHNSHARSVASLYHIPVNPGDGGDDGGGGKLSWGPLGGRMAEEENTFPHGLASDFVSARRRLDASFPNWSEVLMSGDRRRAGVYGQAQHTSSTRKNRHSVEALPSPPPDTMASSSAPHPPVSFSYPMLDNIGALTDDIRSYPTHDERDFHMPMPMPMPIPTEYEQSHHSLNQDAFSMPDGSGMMSDEGTYGAPAMPLDERIPEQQQQQQQFEMPEQMSIPVPMGELGSLQESDQVPARSNTRTIPKPEREVTKDANGRFYCNFPGCAEDIKEFGRRCEWNKHMDKHDRPYKCLAGGCEKLPGFTYSGGLLRHEREVHNKHGGPKKRFACPHQNCKRYTGKGFTRQENLSEHLRRVHTQGGIDGKEGLTIDSEEEDEIEQQQPTSQKRKRVEEEEDTQDEVKRLRAEGDGLRAENEGLRAENEALRRQVEHQTATTNEMTRQILRLQQQQQQLQNQQLHNQQLHNHHMQNLPVQLTTVQFQQALADHAVGNHSRVIAGTPMV